LTLGDILDVLEGVSSPAAPPDDSIATAADVLQDVWRDIAAHYQRLIHQISIEQLVQRQAEREARSMYYI
jgi:DNA-binding IscR family transcriptional regulator